VLLVCAPLVGLGALTLQPGLVSYCGLSGVLNGVWVCGALLSAREENRRGNRLLAWLFRACVLADVGKIAWEASSGAPIFTDAALGELGRRRAARRSSPTPPSATGSRCRSLTLWARWAA
jgi:hypothetical protein